MNKIKHRFSLDRPITYEITVWEHIDKNWLDWADELVIVVSHRDDGQHTTSLICTVDQAALHGILRRIYSLGIPLISVNSIETEIPESRQHSKKELVYERENKGS